MIFSSRKIQECLDNGSILIEPFDINNLKPASYTLHLGRIFESTDHSENGFELLPGHCILVTSIEQISLSHEIAAFLSVRGSCARLGIDALGSDLFVEPTWNGHLNFSISNTSQSTVILKYGMPIVKCVFMAVDV